MAVNAIPVDQRVIDIDSRRWAGVPFYLRTVKRAPRRVTEIALNFKRTPHMPFSQPDIEALGVNSLVLRIQPNEGIEMNFEGMKARFYELVGFDPVKGIPTREKLEEYGMGEEAGKVW